MNTCTLMSICNMMINERYKSQLNPVYNRIHKMLTLIFIILTIPGNCTKLLIAKKEQDAKIAICVRDIITRFYENGTKLTYVDINSNDNEILKVINNMSTHLLISRKNSDKFKIRVPHQGYIIYSGNSNAFTKNFNYLRRETTWNPTAKFIIIINDLFKEELQDIFNELMNFHVTDVIVVNGTNETNVYTYNPFENYACGRYFDRIIEFGPCLNLEHRNLFPNKLLTGLKKCTFTVAVPHLPPFTIFPSKLRTKLYMPGIEQYAFEIISKLEDFKINYSYVNFAETFSTVDSDNMEATGFFNLLQKNQTDVLLGFTILTSTRGTAYDFLFAHLAFTDELTYIVKKAGNVPIWMNTYLEFNSTVWILLLFSFTLCSILILILLRTDDKMSIILKLWDSLLLHGYNFRCRFTVKIILLIWVWFAYLINSFYQCSLVSLTTYPSKAHQVSTERELTEFQYRPCISPSIKNFLINEAGMTFDHDTGECEKLIQGIRVMSKKEGLYTVTPLSIYQFNRYMFLDSTGSSKVYHFSDPVMKIMYAIFLYKGFPMYKKLHKHTTYLRENGIIDKYFNDLYFQEKRAHDQIFDDYFKARIIVPWNILIIGCTVASICFMLEVLSKRVINIVL